MKTKRLATMALAGAMTLSLATPAFASSKSTEISGTFQDTPIEVVVTPTAAAFINPYGLDLKVEKEGNEITDSTPAADIITISGQQVVTSPMSLMNQSAMDLVVSATITGTVAEASDMRLAVAPVPAGDTGKNAFIYLQAKQEASLTGAFTGTGSVDAAAVATKYAAWAASAYDEDADLVVGTREASKEGIVTLAAADTTNSTPAYNAGSIALVRLAGSVSTAPRSGWAETDTFTVNVAYTFAPATKYEITKGAMTKAPGAASNVNAPTSFTIDATNALEGATVTVTVVADNAQDTIALTVKGADNTAIPVTGAIDSSVAGGKTWKFTFTMPAQSVTVDGTYSGT